MVRFAGGHKGNIDGELKESQFNGPTGIAIDHKTNTCYVADSENNTIRSINFS